MIDGVKRLATAAFVIWSGIRAESWHTMVTIDCGHSSTRGEACQQQTGQPQRRRDNVGRQRKPVEED